MHTSLWFQWLLCVTVALNWLITLYILLIWHHLFSVSQHEKNNCPGKTGLPVSVSRPLKSRTTYPVWVYLVLSKQKRVNMFTL